MYTWNRTFENFGGADGIRTHDLLDAIEARSQLRHSPTVVQTRFTLLPSRLRRDALPTAPQPHRCTNSLYSTTFPVVPGRPPNCATAPPLYKLALLYDLPGCTGTPFQLRHSPTVVQTRFTLRPSRLHRDALPTAPQPRRNNVCNGNIEALAASIAERDLRTTLSVMISMRSS
jgi:hypothetical protein